MIPRAVRITRAEALVIVEQSVDDSVGELERANAWYLRPPRISCGRLACERHRERGSGEWDWLWHLRRSERQRLVRGWTIRGGLAPDDLPPLFGIDGAGLGIDRAATVWVQHTRVIDAGRALGQGKIVNPESFGGNDLDGLFPHTGFVLVRLFAPAPDCVSYVETLDVDEEWTAEDAAAYFERNLG